MFAFKNCFFNLELEMKDFQKVLVAIGRVQEFKNTKEKFEELKEKLDKAHKERQERQEEKQKKR